MKKAYLTIGALSFCMLLGLIFWEISSAGKGLTPLPAMDKFHKIEVSSKTKDEFAIKGHHAGLSFNCVVCHEGQGDNPEDFTYPDEEACLSCHGSKKDVANRLSFMDTLGANPHNSIHDGTTLYCDECHREHEPSVNMCADCHEKEIKTNIWMRETP